MLYPAVLPAEMDHAHRYSQIMLMHESSPKQSCGTRITETDYVTASSLHVFVSKILKKPSFT